jgi:hypothetical protein
LDARGARRRCGWPLLQLLGSPRIHGDVACTGGGAAAVHVPSLTRAVGRYGCIGFGRFCSHFWVFIKSVGRRVASSGHHSLSHLDGNERCGRAVHDQGGVPHRCIVHDLFLPFFRARLDVHNTKQKRPRTRKADTCSKTVPLTFHFCILPEKNCFYCIVPTTPTLHVPAATLPDAWNIK